MLPRASVYKRSWPRLRPLTARLTLRPVGVHFLLELRGCPAELLDDPAHVDEVLRGVVARADLTLLEHVARKFDPCGVTAIALLSESHLSVHTWPEHGYAAADLFTCGDPERAEQACRYLIVALGAAAHELQRVPRGALPPI